MPPTCTSQFLSEIHPFFSTLHAISESVFHNDLHIFIVNVLNLPKCSVSIGLHICSQNWYLGGYID